MPKNLLQDMVRIKRENNRSRMTSVKEEPRVTQSYHETSSPREVAPQVFSHERSGEIEKIKKGKSRHMLWLVAILSIIFFLYSISFIFLKVTVDVNPKMQEVILNENLSASLSAGSDALAFDLVVISGEESKAVKTSLVEDVSKSAKGIVVIYNIFSSSPQRLSVDTRLVGSNGKIYKTQKETVVPGMKGTKPGSVEVGIYAAVAGEGYNSDPLDFTILGFKGTPKYEKFYARSKGEISGGFKGTTPVLSEADKESALNDLKTILQAKLFKKAKDQIPSGFVLFKDAVFFDIDEDSIDQIPLEDGSLSLKLKATLNGFLFNEEDLIKKIAALNIDKYDGSSVYISDMQDLVFRISDKDNDSFNEVKKINFNISGATKIIWKVNEIKLIADLLGKSKKDFSQILSKYSSIDSADLTISPFWKTSLPDKSKNIKVIVNYPK